nr:laminin subunit alpha-1 isoform X1 [Onthophagus taurus]
MTRRTVYFFFLLLLSVESGSSGKAKSHTRNRQALKFMKNRTKFNPFDFNLSEDAGLWPKVFNVATKALISVNATCGEGGREEFCRMSEKYARKCEICDNFSEQSKRQRHPIHNAIDGTVDWWQSPALHYGQEYEYITITLDLKQVYQVTHVTIKAAISPRPGSWILERSIDGIEYQPWQYYARTDRECLERYGIPSKKGKPHYDTDTEVICTSHYSKLTPVENGEIHTLMHDRPGANERSLELLEFTKARFVRIRLQGLKRSHEMAPKRFVHDHLWNKRLFYSIRDIQIGGQCVCNGHASDCRHDVSTGRIECLCAHNTCGSNCNKCCPLFNQRKWSPGTTREARECVPCNCNGHAESCHYDENIEKENGSMDMNGNFIGGGVCDNCTAFTTGINCELCQPGYYRPSGTQPDAKTPCLGCNCDPSGSTGSCTVKKDLVLCECRPGFSGARCDVCAPGYRGYPNCELCPCDSRGTIGPDDCEDKCICKVNVEGSFCERCKSGYFALEDRNPDGCSSCYCSGVTTLCEAAVLSSQTFRTPENWRASDISLNNVEKAITEDGLVSLGTLENSVTNSFYFLAPEIFVGNKLQAYGSNFIFKTQWYVMRGDTSGKPDISPNIVLIGSNGLIIGQGNNIFNGANATFKIPLTEGDWFKIKLDKNEIIDYSILATRADFLSVLTDIKHILLRAKFHTDQIEVALEEAYIEIQEGISLVEKCSCPSGYTGFSCESCDYGYVRLYTNVSNRPEKFCVKCDCNGHSKTCDPDTGQCQCEHNTMGETCDRCLPGFYGNPLMGTSEDCRKCACPLEEEENNFSPSCQLDSLSISNDYNDIGYVCTQCPKGYTGDHCEICDDGYFGLPTQSGSKCQLCSCGGNPCDRTTGKCLSCRGNTEGWRCERCKSGYFGDPTAANCQACSCDAAGSLSENCDNVTGLCQCKENFVGRTCDRCKEGYGNVTAGCVPCECNLIGSNSGICDQRTGLCYCKSGVEGFHCDACQHLHYNFSEQGCQSCNCNPKGSELETCDIKDGKCRCKPHYTGRSCDRCEDGYYWNSADECVSCECNRSGSDNITCNQKTGQCSCKPGVTGLKCDKCLPSYYGFSKNGCNKCEDCSAKPGHICDPKTGRCVCPMHTTGSMCDRCVSNSWGFKPNLGCKECDCSKSGSTNTQCSLDAGVCSCKPEYTGEKCNRCKHGFYGYPHCKPCDCNVDGTDSILGKCTPERICQCDENGNCPCKRNVHGKECNNCKSGYFGLQTENPDGCMECFCFGRSRNCTNAPYTWEQNRTISTRFLTHGDISSKSDVIESENIISGDYNNYTIGDTEMIQWINSMKPLYWRLPHSMSGDMTRSYNGYLRFSIQSSPPTTINDADPLVKLKGNDLELHYYPRSPSNHYEIKLHEDGWKLLEPTKKYSKYKREYKNGFLSAKLKRINKTGFMIALQNVTEIFVKATDSVTKTFDNLSLSDIVIDTAMEIKGNPQPKAIGIEMCSCPPQYTGLSCQNPNKGYFRFRDEEGDLIDKVLGRAELCSCSGRSSECDVETGKCLNCKNNTDGINCENCAEGFYGDPLDEGFCRPCPCPTPEKNFAISCKQLHRHNFQCICKKGHTGLNCANCAENYYRDPNFPDGKCIPCNCNPFSSNGKCDHLGQCMCKTGFTGMQCSQCEKTRHIVKEKDCIPCDQCTQLLLDKLDDLSNIVHGNTSLLLTAEIRPPWEKLHNFSDKYMILKNKFDVFQKDNDNLNDFINGDKPKLLEKETNSIKEKFQKTHSDLINITKNAVGVQKETDDGIDELNKIMKDLDVTMDMLKNFGKERVKIKDALKEAKMLLNEIRNKHDKIKDINNNEVYGKCKELEETVEKIHKDDISGKTRNLQTDLRHIKHFLEKTDENLKEIESVVAETIQRNVMNTDRISELKTNLEQQKPLLMQLEDEINEANAILKKTSNELDATADILDDVPTKKLQESTVDMENRGGELAKEIQLLKKFVDLGKKHIRDLNTNVTHIEKILKLSNKEVDAVKASEAYSNIVANLKNATEIATEAKIMLHNLLDQINGTKNDTLRQTASISLATSTRLQMRLRPLQNKKVDIEEKLDMLEHRLQRIKSKNWDNGILNGNQSQIIRELVKEYDNVTNLKSEVDEAIKQSDNMKNVYTKAQNMQLKMQYELNKLHARCMNLSSQEQIQKMNQQISEAKSKIQKLLTEKLSNFNDIKKFDSTSENFMIANKTLSQRLDELKRKVQKSKEIANGIHVSMSGDHCQRSYQLKNLRPSLITHVIIRLQIHEETKVDKQISVFHLENDGDHIKVDINDLLVQFSIKIGDEILKHNLTGNVGVNKIVLERITRNLKLTVNDKIDNLQFNKTLKVFNVSAGNLIYVGGKEKTGLNNICLDDIIVNNMRIGLWDFKEMAETPSNCIGCIQSQMKIYQTDGVHTLFNGEGYSLIKAEHRLKKNEFSVHFTLRTFDENALLFLAIDPNKTNSYLAITLNGGYLQYEIHYSDSKNITLRTDNKYNTGKHVLIDFKKFFKDEEDTSLITVNNERTNSSKKIEMKKKLILRKTNFYVGGVPPDYKIQCPNCTKELHTHQSLLGDIISFNAGNTIYQLYETSTKLQQYGVELLSTPFEFAMAWFEGDGYLQLRAQLNKTFSISFVLRTQQQNGVIIYITNVGELLVESGYLIGQFHNEKAKTKVKVDDDEYHIVELRQEANKITLKVGEIAEILMKESTKMPGDVYLGGNKITINKFNGEIRDLIIDDKLVLFNSETINEFEKVKIGRSKPQKLVEIPMKLKSGKDMLKMRDVAENMKDMQSTEGCNKVGHNYTLIPNAAKFGDVSESYITYHMKESFWKNEYTIELEFRTFYKNGLLLFAQGDGKHYYLLELKDNIVLLHASGKKKKIVQITKIIDDGNWHKILIERRFDRKKKKRKVTILSVDGSATKPQKLPQGRVFGEMYVGDIAKNAQHKLKKQTITKINQFKGCIKPLKINNTPRKFDEIHNIGQCFPNIEKGSYFRGDSYAIYNKNFRMTNYLELNLEFRTTEQNGILMSVSSPNNSPAISLELYNGAVVLSVDLGDRPMTNVTNSLSDYALCNNMWHNLTALISTELTVNVDGVSKSWVLSDDNKDEIEGSLYIGGIPDYAPEGTLKVRENFKGCIRNLKIDENQVDWTKMEELNNISLNSCPVT